MATLQVLETLSQSDKSWEDAAQKTVDDCARPGREVKSVYLKNAEAVVENGRIAQYRINAKVTFLAED